MATAQTAANDGAAAPLPCRGGARGGVTDFIRELSETVKVKGGAKEQELFYEYLKKWLVAMVVGWLVENVVNNVILVLIGEQGSYKTTWFNYILPPQIRNYFYTKTNAKRMTMDDLLTLAQYGLVCCEELDTMSGKELDTMSGKELDTMSGKELNQLKAAVTMPSINERVAYAHYAEHRKHIASFCGTGNNIQFLSDPTSNRRWLPFEIESIQSPREHPFNYEGGLDEKGKPADTRTPAQKAALLKLLRRLKREHPDAEILGHRDLPDVHKDCPCFDCAEYNDLIPTEA